MGKCLSLTLAIIAVLSYEGEARGAHGAMNSAPCLSHCSLERDDDGRASVLCSCLEKKYSGRDNFFGLMKRSPDRFEGEIQRRLRGANSLETAAVAGNSCALDVSASHAHPRPASTFVHLASLSMRPTCECVRNRVQFPVSRSCAFTKAGQVLCQFDLALNNLAHEGPVRAGTLHDYQACAAARINYRRPETCAAVVCEDQPRECPLGQELVNVADPESCCPSFECRGEEGK
jgi:hypothetical protein